VNCSTTWTQLLEYAKQAQQLATQLQQYETQLQQYANMVTNTVALPQQMWGTVQADIMQVRSLSNAASLLSGNAGSIVTRLQSASGYASQAANLGNIAGQFTTWQQTIGDNVNTLGRTLALQQDQQAGNATLLTTLESHSQSAQGQMQAIQAGNELAHANAAQLQQIQATLTATAQMQATGMAVDADRRASEDAAMLHFSTPQAIQTSGYPQY
jgi:P-type conjugative transfer protein TrbJ